MQWKARSEVISADSSATGMKFSTAISMDEIKPVVTEKSQFDCRHESKILALSDFLDY